MLERPDDGVEHQLELRGWDVEQRLKAMGDDLLQHQKEVGAMLGELLEILVDHVERTLEHSVEYFRYLGRDVVLRAEGERNDH